jgi:hypothetical protein
MYRERNLVERVFNELRRFLANATGCNSLAATFLAAVQMVCIRCWLNCLHTPVFPAGNPEQLAVAPIGFPADDASKATY